jgi:hypothetical protein
VIATDDDISVYQIAPGLDECRYARLCSSKKRLSQSSVQAIRQSSDEYGELSLRYFR